VDDVVVVLVGEVGSALWPVANAPSVAATRMILLLRAMMTMSRTGLIRWHRVEPQVNKRSPMMNLQVLSGMIYPYISPLGPLNPVKNIRVAGHVAFSATGGKQ
jgi:hypothetical protein